MEFEAKPKTIGTLTDEKNSGFKCSAINKRERAILRRESKEFKRAKKEKYNMMMLSRHRLYEGMK